MQQVIIKEKNVYGNVLLYPVCENASYFLLLTRKATFTEADIIVMQMLGFKVDIQKLP